MYYEIIYEGAPKECFMKEQYLTNDRKEGLGDSDFLC